MRGADDGDMAGLVGGDQQRTFCFAQDGWQALGVGPLDVADFWGRHGIGPNLTAPDESSGWPGADAFGRLPQMLLVGSSIGPPLPLTPRSWRASTQSGCNRMLARGARQPRRFGPASAAGFPGCYGPGQRRGDSGWPRGSEPPPRANSRACVGRCPGYSAPRQIEGAGTDNGAGIGRATCISHPLEHVG